MPAWRIWYADGSTFDSTQGPPEAANGFAGVQVICQPDRTPGVGNVGYLTIKGYDWWYWHLDSQEWMGCMGDSSMFHLILSRAPIAGVCQGMRIPDERFHAIEAMAKEWAREMGLPLKSAFRPDEKA